MLVALHPSIAHGRRAAGAARSGLAVWRSAARRDCAPVLGLGSRRTTHCVRFALSVQTGAASQTTKRAARADPKPALLTAPHRAQGGQRLPRGSGSDVDERFGNAFPSISSGRFGTGHLNAKAIVNAADLLMQALRRRVD